MAEAMKPDLRPLVIVGVGGGLVQWEITKPGVGMPRLITLDYDREGQSGDELTDFAEEIGEAYAALREYNDPKDSAALRNMAQSINEYERMARDGESAGRYR